MPLSIYLIEDSAVIRATFIEFLEEQADAVAVGWADGEDQAVSWLLAPQHRWDVAIVDLFLAQGNGLGILRQVRQARLTQPMVVLTNYATADIKSRCLAQGATQVFDKSTEIEAFMEFIAAVEVASPNAPRS